MAPRARPLSPHLEIYRFTLTMAMSIVHRITGVGELCRHAAARRLAAGRGDRRRGLRAASTASSAAGSASSSSSATPGRCSTTCSAASATSSGTPATAARPGRPRGDRPHPARRLDPPDARSPGRSSCGVAMMDVDKRTIADPDDALRLGQGARRAASSPSASPARSTSSSSLFLVWLVVTPRRRRPRRDGRDASRNPLVAIAAGAADRQRRRSTCGSACAR